MLRKLSQAFVIFAVIAAIGGHWAVLQTVAWTTMLATNLRTNCFEEAVTKTFDGEHPCRLCKVVADGRKAAKKADLPASAKKFEFVTDAREFIFSSPQEFWLVAEVPSQLETLPHAPPSPPPRFL